MQCGTIGSVVRATEILSARLSRAQRLLANMARRRLLRGVIGIDDIAAQVPTEFKRLQLLVRSSGTDSLEHFDNGYTHEGGLSLQQNPDEFAALCAFLKARGPFDQYVEIGSASGGACLLLCREVAIKRVLSIDDGRHARAAEQEANFAEIPNVTQFRGDSHSAAARAFLSAELEEIIDLALIDGDHTASGVWLDFELLLPFCAPDSLIVFHDTVACRGVEMAWLRAVRQGSVIPIAEFVGRSRPLGIAVGRVP